MKINNNKGFTLIETLCAIVLLVFVTSLITSGLDFTVNNSSKIMGISEAQILSRTLRSAISDEFRYASDIEVKHSSALGEDVVTFESYDYAAEEDGHGNTFGVFIEDKEGRVVIYEKDDEMEFNKLISDKVYTYDNKARVDIKLSEGKDIVQVKLEILDKNDEVIKTTEFEVKPINQNSFATETNVS